MRHHQHLNVKYQGEHAHLFFDEEGLLKARQIPNDRASAIHANSHLARTRGLCLSYNNVLEAPPLPALFYFATMGALIIGNAYLWTGDME